MPWLPRYFHYSIEAKQVESTGTGSDRSFTGMFMCVLSVLQCLKRNENKQVEREEYSETQRGGKHKKDYFCDFCLYI